MTENWKFSKLEYVRPDAEAFKLFLTDCARKIRSAASPAEIFETMSALEERQNAFATQGTLAFVRNTLNTADPFYEEEVAFWNRIEPELMPGSLAVSDALAESPFRKEIEQKFGKQLFVKMDLEKRGFCEKNIPLMQREAELTTEYQKMMASCAIDFDGKTLNLYGIEKYFEHDDREIRRRACLAYSGFYRDNETRLEEIWDELIRIRNEMGRNLGFEDFIPLGYIRQGRTDYGVKEVASFREQVRTELVPLCEKLYAAQRKRLGVEHLYAWDEKRIYPDGNAVPAGDDDFMIAAAQEMYHELSPETAEFIDFMIDHDLTDLKNAPNKAATGYQTDLPSLRAPFVFSVFNGTIGDMQVLTHELGHAFAAYSAMRSQPISDYWSESTDIAEIHSMSMEQFAYPYAEKFFGADAEKFRFAHLQEALTFVPFGVAVDEFQHVCYANPSLSPKERTWEWHKLEEKYMPWRRYDEEDEFYNRGGWWYHKLHIYLYPFYYINYTLTTMGAMEFKAKNAADHDAAWRDYLKLCRCGGSMSYLETLRYTGLAIPFEAGGVKRAVEYARGILLKKIETEAE